MSSVVELYLLQLRSLLPRKRREDVAAEIRARLATAIEERERGLGRELDEAEAAELLKFHGHPAVVAGRYLPMGHLIGPTVFPVYWYTVQAVLAAIAAAGGIVIALALLTEPGAARAAMRVLVRFVWLALDAGAVVTLLFALLERYPVRLRFLEDFDPRPLAGRRGRAPQPIGELPRSRTARELALAAILLLWWTGWLDFPSVAASVKVELGAGATSLHVPVVMLCTADLFRLAVDCVHPFRTRVRTGVAIAVNSAWLVVFLLAITSAQLVQVAPSVEDPAEIARVAGIADRVFRLALLGFGVFRASWVAADVVRLRRR
jgi:hypothetical protein